MLLLPLLLAPVFAISPSLIFVFGVLSAAALATLGAVVLARFRGEPFWGHDRLDHVARHLAGAGPPSSGLTEKMLARPRGAVRKGAPPRSS